MTGGASADQQKSDGRRRRSQKSREKIVAAMLTLVRSGNVHLSAAPVAEEAGVSLRTVFRHFEDMDSLYREMTPFIEAEILPILAKPYEASGWQDRLFELLDRRADIYERIMPIRVSASIRRFRSPYLMEDHERFLKLERTGLEAILPDFILADRTLFPVLEMVTSFQAWRRLRQEQGLSEKEAAASLRLAVTRLVG
jgi:AcrR family transcriptional regulator